MLVYYDGKWIVSAQTGITPDRAVEVLTRMVGVLDLVLLCWLVILALSPHVSRRLCIATLCAFGYGMVLSTATWIPSSRAAIAVNLMRIHDHGQTVTGLALLATGVIFLWVLARRLAEAIMRRN